MYLAYCLLGGDTYINLWQSVTGVYYDIQEIVPSVRGDYRVNRANVPLSKFNSKEIEVRALIEGQFLAKRAYAEDLGFSSGE
jgi:xylulokinase